jgi:hypothetical protein
MSALKVLKPFLINTSVTEAECHLYIGSLIAPVLGRIEKEKIGL